MTTQDVSKSLSRSIGWAERLLGTDLYRTIKRFIASTVSIIGITLLVMFVLLAIAAPVLAPPYVGGDPYQIPRDGYASEPMPPGSLWEYDPPPLPFWWKAVVGTDQWTHLLGAASGGWDIYYGAVWGTRTALKVGLLITLCVTVIGIVVGSVSAYFGGVLDNVLMRITDIFLAFPFLLAALTLSALLTPLVGRGVLPAFIALITFGWMGYARLIRSDILSIREREYVLAARVIGVSDFRIVLRHILPNAIFPTLVVASLATGAYVLTFAGLSFLGVGTEVGYADWGQLLAFARAWISVLEQYWYIVAFPGVLIVLFVLAWNLVGDALRDALDPRMRGMAT